MTRRRAAERHQDSRPAQRSQPEETALLDALVALHHPSRRRLFEVLTMSGPASVGSLAQRTGLAPGSVSHHMKALHRNGFAEPAEDLARDTRESWWRPIDRNLSWDPAGFAPGSVGRRVALLAELANIRHQNQATMQWLSSRESLPPEWADAWQVHDSLVNATPEQCEDLGRRMKSLLHEWRQECLAEGQPGPDPTRRPVRVVVRVFPSQPEEVR